MPRRVRDGLSFNPDQIRMDPVERVESPEQNIPCISRDAKTRIFLVNSNTLVRL